MPARLAFGATSNPMRINAEQTALEMAAGAADFTAFRPTGAEFFCKPKSLMT
jgi:hypothetical protein